MITYAERVCFREPHLRLLARVAGYVARVADAWGNELRCHELVRAVHAVVSVDERATLLIVDGKCGPVEHSWLYLPDGAILDPYVPGRLPAVQLVDWIVATLYQPGETRSDIRHAVVDLLVLEMQGSSSER